MTSGLAGECLHSAVAFGLRWHSAFPLQAFHPEPALTFPADIRVEFDAGPAPDRGHAAEGRHVHFAPGGFRYNAGDVATIDAYAPGRIVLHAGPSWKGVAPAALFSTVTALLVAFCGLIPIHGSAVEFEGAATLLCGPAGTGKSTSAARLIAKGARLISDDLTILHPDPSGGPPRLFAGRRAMRLFESTAAALAPSVVWREPSQAAEGKLAVFPPQVDSRDSIPLRTVIVLGSPAGPVPGPRQAGLLADQLFRPVLLRRVPGHAFRVARLAILARQLEIRTAPGL